MFEISILALSLKITNLGSQRQLPGANELSVLENTIRSIAGFAYCKVWKGWWFYTTCQFWWKSIYPMRGSVPELISPWDILSTFCETGLRIVLQNPIDNKSTLLQVMAWCHQATSYYLSQCWARSMLPYGITRPWWVHLHPMYLHHSRLKSKKTYSYMLSRVVRNRYSRLLFTSEDHLCASLRVQEQSMNMMSQCQCLAFTWHHRSTVMTSQCQVRKDHP